MLQKTLAKMGLGSPMYRGFPRGRVEMKLSPR